MSFTIVYSYFTINWINEVISCKIYVYRSKTRYVITQYFLQLYNVVMLLNNMLNCNWIILC